MRLLLILLMLAGCAINHNQELAEQMRYEVQDKVFLLETRNEKGKALGSATGFVLSYEGHNYMITAAHICESEPIYSQKYIIAKKNKITWKLKVLKISDEADLCLLQTPKGVKGLKLASEIKMESWGYIVGYPIIPYMTIGYGLIKGRYDTHMLADWFSDDIKCKQKKYHEHKEIIMTPYGPMERTSCFMKTRNYATTIKAGPGGSGGPAINDNKEVIGVLSLYESAVGWGILVTLEDIEKFVKSIKRKKK